VPGTSPQADALNDYFQDTAQGDAGSLSTYLGSARGGRIVNPYGYDDGGTVSDEPINIDAHSIVPAMQLRPISAHIPQVNLNPPQQSNSGSGLGDILKIGTAIAGLFAARGGAIRNPYYQDGGTPTFDDRCDAAFPHLNSDTGDSLQSRLDAAHEAIATGSFDPQGINSTGFDPPATRGLASNIVLPKARPAAADAPVVDDDDADVPANAAPGSYPSNPFRTASADDDTGINFAKSPWLALTAAGLGMMGGTSPWAGVNIGTGGLQGVKVLEEQRAASQKDETIEQAAQKLQQEAQEHLDAMTKMTPYQQAQIALKRKDQGSENAEIKSIADAIESGEQPPTLAGLYGKSAAVRAELADRKVPLAKMQLQYAAAQKQIGALNGPQMTRFAGLATSVDRTIDEVSALADEMKNSGITALNHAKLLALVHGRGNTPEGQLATRYLTAVNTLKEEFANLANGGYAPTEPAWKLANEQIDGNYGVDQLKGSLGEVQRLIRYRVAAITNFGTLGPGAQNRYTGNPGPTTGSPPATPNSQPPVKYQNGHEYHLQPDGSYQ
jgi:hypothetical protein